MEGQGQGNEDRQGQGNEDRQGSIHRQHSNWAQGITNLSRNLNATTTNAFAASDDANSSIGSSGLDNGRPHTTQEVGA